MKIIVGSKNPNKVDAVIGVLSKGMIDRKKFTEHAIQMSLVHYISKEIFI